MASLDHSSFQNPSILQAQLITNHCLSVKTRKISKNTCFFALNFLGVIQSPSVLNLDRSHPHPDLAPHRNHPPPTQTSDPAQEFVPQSQNPDNSPQISVQCSN